MQHNAPGNRAIGHTPPAADSTDGSAPRPWYVCFTKPRQEQYAAGKLMEQGFEVYLPVLQSWARQAGTWRKKHSVMFPRYAFVRPVRATQAIGPVASTPGITGLVRFGSTPATLADARLQALRSLTLARASATPQQPFDAGQQVVFSAGPLKGASGIVSTVAAERVGVLMTLLGQSHTVQVAVRDLALA